MAATSTPQAFSHRIGRLAKGVLLLLLLGVVVGAVLVLSTGRPEPLPVAPSALQAESLRLAPPSPRESNDLVYRPLFWEGRRPLEAPELADIRPVEQASNLNEFDLHGVFVSDTQSGVILTVRGERRRLLLGESVDGWTLNSLASHQATFIRDGTGNDAAEEEVLVLEPLMSANRAATIRLRALDDQAPQDPNNDNQPDAQESERNTNE